MNDRSYGNSALATPANAITMARILLAPIAFALILDRPTSWPTVGMWFLLSVTDGFDGLIARRYGTTRSGAFLDPLADKVLVIGGMTSMVLADVFPVVPVLIIIGREIAISVFRSWYGRQGLAVPASRGAKLKTLLQLSSVGWVTLPLTGDVEWLWRGTLYAAVVMTVLTGVQYLRDGSQGVSTTGERV